MKQLTKKQKIFVLEKMIEYYSDDTEGAYYRCMCGKMDSVIHNEFNINTDELDIGYLFPEFFEGKIRSGWWFEKGLAKPRLDYCKQILKLIESK